MVDLIGKSLGRYHIIEKLGEGGMAIVYRAYDTRLETDVAIKFIRMERLTPENADKTLKRFEREAKALAKLSHPNIVKVTDYGDYDGRPYLVMPYLSGGTLKQRLNGQPLHWREAAKLLTPIAEALDYAHRQGILHRDIKSSNILITDSGAPMLADFGVAKLFEVEETVDLTGTGVGIGTPEYMAPEQGRGRTDQRSEVYSLGIVFYEMVTGRKPYTAETPLAVLIMQASDPLEPPHKLVSNLPSNVEGIIFKALAKAPESRYQSMTELSSALQKVATGERLGSAWSGKWTSRRTAGFATLFAFLIVLVLGARYLPVVVESNSVYETATGADQPNTPSPVPTISQLITVNASDSAINTCLPTDESTLAKGQASLGVLVPDAQVTWYDDFSCDSLGPRWNIQRTGSRTRLGIPQGHVMIETDKRDNVWDRIYGDYRISDGNGSLALFSYGPGSNGSLYIEAGTWDTANYLSRSLEITAPAEGRWFTWIGRTPDAKSISLALRPEEWYYFMITAENGQIRIKVWNKDRPNEMDESTIALGDANTSWRFAVETHDKWIKVDEYFEFDY